jgi:hypothetical protein
MKILENNSSRNRGFSSLAISFLVDTNLHPLLDVFCDKLKKLLANLGMHFL